MPKTQTSRSKVASGKGSSRSTRARVVTGGQSKLAIQNKRNLWIAVVAFVVIGFSTLAWSYASTASYSLWSSNTIPKYASFNDAKSVEVGVKFRSKYTGNVTSVRFYKGASNTGMHIGSLWSASGQELARVTFSGESSSGWQQATFAKPVNISANTTYVVSYFAPNGYYAANPNYFNARHTKGPLTALKDGTVGGNGVYSYTSAPSFPSQTYGSTNYWVDLVFTTSRIAPSPQPLPPSNLKAAVNSGTIQLNWTASTTTGIAKYTILRDGVVTGSTAGGAVTSYTDTKVVAGQSYSYQVEALDGSGNASNPTSSVSIAVPADSTGGGVQPPPVPANDKNCFSKPSACGYPDETNTGWQHTGVSLKVVTQDPYVIDTPGAIISGLDIHGCVDVLAQNVTIKNSRITCNNQPMIKNFEVGNNHNLIDVGAGLLLQDVELNGMNDADSAGVAFNNYKVIRGNFHNIGTAVRLGDNVDIEDSYVHDIAATEASHNGGLPSDGGAGITLKHNTVFVAVQNGDPIELYNGESTQGGIAVVKNVVVDNNFLAGGNYIMFCGILGNTAPNLTVTNNRFSRAIFKNGGFYGDTSNCSGAAAWSNNYWDEDLSRVGN